MIHLAANTGVIPSIENPKLDMNQNVVGLVNCLEVCRHYNIKKFIFASSGAALGDQTPPLHEEMLPKPLSPYGASKMCGENYCSAYHGTYDIETIAFRFSNVYGPYSMHKGSLVSKFINSVLNWHKDFTIYGDGNQTRDFIYVNDLVKVLFDASHSDIAGEIFQLANGIEHGINKVITHMNELSKVHFGRDLNIIHEDARKGEVFKSYADISKVKDMLNYEPTYSLQDGLTRTFRWFEQEVMK
jgi:UDP-glucose 4-epimerase